jgi:16S rRNA (guanine527-N7)-methyltransferase
MNNSKKLINDAKSIGLELDMFHMKQFEKYQELLLEWNEKINLTAITEEDDIITKHFIDSLTCLKYIKGDEKIIDVGTGAGFPGIPVKIVSHETKVTLLDSLNKRINYLNDVIEKLGLENVETIHARAEELGQNEKYRESFDIATARAVANLKVLVEYCLPFVKVGGIFICMKGSEYKEEIEEAKAHIGNLGGKITNIEEIILPDTDIKHTIIIIEKTKSTPKNFPRRKIK